MSADPQIAMPRTGESQPEPHDGGNQPEPAPQPETPFHDLDHYVAIPRLSGLVLSPDGTRLVTTVATLSGKGTEYGTALWELDPAGERPARRITRSAKGEAGAAFAANGDLFFTSARPDPEKPDDEPVSALWLLPHEGGEARVVLSRAGGVSSVLAARSADATFVQTSVLPGSTDEADDEARRTARKDGKVAAILHSGYPVRFWDADLGPAEPRLFAVERSSKEPEPGKPSTLDEGPALELRNLTPGVGGRLRFAEASVSPDGATLYAGLAKPLAKADLRDEIVAVDVASGTHRTLLSEELKDFFPGPASPDGRMLAVVVEPHTTPTQAYTSELHLLDLASGELRRLAPAWDRLAHPAAWLPDGSALLVTADDGGRSPIFRIDVASGAVTRVTHDDAAYSDVVVSPDGAHAYALRSSYLLPPEVVRIELAGGGVSRLKNPAERPEIPGRLHEVTTTAEDGTPLRAWLALPPSSAESASPGDGAAVVKHPLLVWIHGGPIGSWNAWTWRWNPWLMTAQGYAVLLPDPALSTGYGQDFIQRGWGRWGAEPFSDIMALTDAALRRPDLDPTRTAAMGGSFGGYMANWVAGHTDRFRAIVTHASLWALEGFGLTTDMAHYWAKEMDAAMTEANSPHRAVGEIRTPMLVIHGDKDYRVPIGEGLRLWYELLSASQLAADADGASPHRFLYFPDENHWILKPQHAKVWYGVVNAFLAEHVLGEERELPRELGL
ncbi:prolyl oligopeptidase family serine peptidase [Sinomonas sp. JGH33]|uniref:Prolyl oligopeptidase family serine peptidase n=1 Tax=Sinomonas terricola TaxID=3110330 RepID=A0ABU5T5N0_9MICC|nr:prolyl oligopeptidase family serine peptidase [Sinomonas sp. JGH33]MEA5454796.1 prolyl oligopeptidase family serine peptidase [Sinomonas sp. JGH33]